MLMSNCTILEWIELVGAESERVLQHMGHIAARTNNISMYDQVLIDKQYSMSTTLYSTKNKK